MKKIITTFILFTILTTIFSQDTLSVKLLKRTYRGSTTNNIKKAKFAIYTIKNSNGSLTTIHYSFLKNRIETSTTYKGKEPYGVWINTFTRNGKEIIEETNYNYVLVYCKNTELDKDVFDKKRIRDLDETDKFIKLEPIGGMQAVFNVISKVDYPNIAMDNDIQGKVFIQIIVNKDGTHSNYCILRGVHPLLDKTAMSQVMKIDNFTPATLNGEKVKSNFIIPVVFMIE